MNAAAGSERRTHLKTAKQMRHMDNNVQKQASF